MAVDILNDSMKKILLVSIVLIFTHSFIEAQVKGNSIYNEMELTDPFTGVNVPVIDSSAITVQVRGLMNAIPENYVAVFNIVQVGETAEQTEQLMTARIRKFKLQLKNTGIDTAAIKTDMVSFVPKYDYHLVNKIFSKSYNEVPDGFELQKNVTIHYKASAMLDRLVSAAAAVEIYDLVKVDYFINSIDENYKMLRDKCFALLKTKIRSYEDLGFKLDTIHNKTFADQALTILPASRYAGYQAISRPSMDAVKRANTSIKFNDRSRSNTRYYDAVAYDRFDVIVNPVIDEPVVQLTYHLVIRYFLKNEGKNINDYFIIAPSGEVKKLNIK